MFGVGVKPYIPDQEINRQCLKWRNKTRCMNMLFSNLQAITRRRKSNNGYKRLTLGIRTGIRRDKARDWLLFFNCVHALSNSFKSKYLRTILAHDC